MCAWGLGISAYSEICEISANTRQINEALQQMNNPQQSRPEWRPNRWEKRANPNTIPTLMRKAQAFLKAANVFLQKNEIARIRNYGFLAQMSKGQKPSSDILEGLAQIVREDVIEEDRIRTARELYVISGYLKRKKLHSEFLKIDDKTVFRKDYKKSTEDIYLSLDCHKCIEQMIIGTLPSISKKFNFKKSPGLDIAMETIFFGIVQQYEYQIIQSFKYCDLVEVKNRQLMKKEFAKEIMNVYSSMKLLDESSSHQCKFTMGGSAYQQLSSSEQKLIAQAAK